MLHPVGDYDQMLSQVLIVGLLVWILSGWSSHDDSAIMSVYLVMPGVTMIELSSGFRRFKHISERGCEVNRTLSYERDAVHVRRRTHMKAMPVDRRARAAHLIRNIDDNDVIPADVNRRSGNFPIDTHHTPLDAVGGDALVVEAVVDIAVRSSTAPARSLIICFMERGDEFLITS